MHCCKRIPPGSELPEGVIRIGGSPSSKAEDPNSIEHHPNFHLINKANHCGKSLASGTPGSSSANINQFPWVALLEYKKNSYDDYGVEFAEASFRCSGTLISEQYVLTGKS